jgi:SAM-dependent methyltransferase
MAMDHNQRQREQNNLAYAAGSRQHVLSGDVVTRYIVSWRVDESIKRLVAASKGLIDRESSILIICSGEGMEGSILCDMGFKNVTVSDLAEYGVQAALNRDKRLKGMVLNAEHLDLPDASVDVVLVQDGLHHLQSPVRGFTEMLRVAKLGVVFLEPHDSLIGRSIGTKWEQDGSALNYVFRWDKKLVEQISSSYLGRDGFTNISFSFWHHNLVFAKLPKLFGSTFGLFAIKIFKRLFDTVMGRFGNQFCCLIMK